MPTSSTNDLPLAPKKKRESEWKLEIHQLDVGQGDSALVLFKKLHPVSNKYEINKSILIDGGKGFNAEYLAQYFYEQGENKDIGKLFGIKEKLLQKRTYVKQRNLNPLQESPQKAKFAEERIKDTETCNQEIAALATEEATLTMQLLNIGSISEKHLNAVIITHDEIDHNGGIFRIIEKDYNLLIGRETKFIIQSGKSNAQDKAYPQLKSFVNSGGYDNSHKTRIIFAYNKLGSSIWEVLGEDKPNGAPDIEFISSDGSFRGDASLKLHCTNNRKSLAQEEKDNESSVVSLISIDNFRYYTAGDFERNKNLIEYLQLKEELSGIKYFPIQAFLVPHHGSSNNINNSFIRNINARAGIASHGGDHGHPADSTINMLENSDVDFVYMTNPKKKKDDDEVIMPDNFIKAGDNTRTASGVRKKCSGVVKVQTYQNIAESGKEKFLIKYKNPKSKTRDYYKDTDFDALKAELLEMISNCDDRCKTSYLSNMKDGYTVVIPLSESDTLIFLDDKKFKHINRSTLGKFFQDYPGEEEEVYSMLISLQDDLLRFEIKSDFFSNEKNGSQSFDTATQAKDFFEEVKGIGTALGNGLVGFYTDNLSDVRIRDEFKTIKGSEVLESRKVDKLDSGKYFLEVVEPENDELEIKIILSEKEGILLKKEYHRGKRSELTDQENPDSFTNKVVARRVEYGTKAQRTP